MRKTEQIRIINVRLSGSDLVKIHALKRVLEQNYDKSERFHSPSKFTRSDAIRFIIREYFKSRKSLK